MPQDPFVQAALAASGDTAKDAQRNALGKQYTMSLRFTITETATNKPFFDSGDVVWHGVPYGVVVVTEKALVELLTKFTNLGAAVATGGEAPTT